MLYDVVRFGGYVLFSAFLQYETHESNMLHVTKDASFRMPSTLETEINDAKQRLRYFKIHCYGR